MGENGVAREQIHTKRCHFMSVLVLVLIHKQLPGFLFFFFCVIIPPPPKTREESWSLAGLCLLQSRSELQQPPFRFSDTCFLPSLLSEVCLSFCEVIKDLVGGGGAAPGLPPPPRRWGGTRTLWSASDSDVREKTRRRLVRFSSVEMAGWTWIFRKTDAMRVLAPHSPDGSACVCVSLLLLGVELYIMKKSPRTRTISQCSRVSNGKCLFIF